jgi:hypothetical protein
MNHLLLCIGYILIYTHTGYSISKSVFTKRLICVVEAISIYLFIGLQPFVVPWPLFQFLNPIHSQQDSLDGGSVRQKASTYTQNDTNTE